MPAKAVLTAGKRHHQNPPKCHRCPETELSPMSCEITRLGSGSTRLKYSALSKTSLTGWDHERDDHPDAPAHDDGPWRRTDRFSGGVAGKRDRWWQGIPQRP